MKYALLLMFLSSNAFATEFKWVAGLKEEGKPEKTQEVGAEATKLLDLASVICLVTAVKPEKGDISKESRFLSCGLPDQASAVSVSCAKSDRSFLGGEPEKTLFLRAKDKTWVLSLSCHPK